MNTRQNETYLDTRHNTGKESFSVAKRAQNLAFNVYTLRSVRTLNPTDDNYRVIKKKLFY